MNSDIRDARRPSRARQRCAAENAFRPSTADAQRYPADSDRARPHLVWVLSRLEEDIEARARFYVMLGGAAELAHDYPAVVDYYTQSWALEPAEPSTWYYANNNLGFSLNALGRFEQGERFCRIAIDVEPTRYNACEEPGDLAGGTGRPR